MVTVQVVHKHCLVLISIAAILFKGINGQYDINIGLLYEENNPLIAKVFDQAIQSANLELLRNANPLVGRTAEITYGNSFDASRKLCKMMTDGVAAIFGSVSRGPSTHAMSLTDEKEILFVDTQWDDNVKQSTINLHPDPKTLVLVLRDLVEAYDWEEFTILYESGPYLPVLDDLLLIFEKYGHPITIRRYDLNLSGNYRNVLRKIRQSPDYRIIIIGSIDTLPELLRQAQQVGLITYQYQYIILNLDFHTIDLEPYQFSETNITSIRLFNPEEHRVKQLSELVDEEQDTYGYNEEEDENNMDDVKSRITTDMALMYDAVYLLAETFRHVGNLELFQPESLDCESSATWASGLTLFNYMKTTTYKGITGEIKFDHQGLRTDFTLDIIELTTSGVVKTGTWNWNPNGNNSVHFEREHHTFIPENADLKFANKTFVVVTAISAPYGMLKETDLPLSGNDQYEGFGIELIHELSVMLGFNYTFKMREDKNYGTCDNVTKACTGMLKEITDGRADLAITDLTMTSDREPGVDFTMPFMNLGISILYRKPSKEAPDFFSFMSPLSKEVWIYLGVAYFGVSLSLFILGRLSPAEWDNPYPCIEEPTVLENQFSLNNAMWFTIGAVLQQGSEIGPKSLSTRTVASIWWFFTLIMVSSYTANLAAFLTIESLSSPINGAEDLAANVGGVTYGAKVGGSTFNFFKGSQDEMYKKMYQYMAAHPEFMTTSNEEGVEKAENENYAFLMESTSIEYNIERKCKLSQIGGLLDEKGYGIAMRKNSPYRNELSQAILNLQEQGVLTKMKNKWWKEKRGGGACSEKYSLVCGIISKVIGEKPLLVFPEKRMKVMFSFTGNGNWQIFSEYLLWKDRSRSYYQRQSEHALILMSKINHEYKQDLTTNNLTGLPFLKCLQKQKTTTDSAEELGMPNLGGIYYVLIVGSFLASIYGICEWFCVIYKRARRFRAPLKEELLEEMKFVLRCSGNTKQVKHRKSSMRSSRNSSLTLESIGTENSEGANLHNANGVY